MVHLQTNGAKTAGRCHPRDVARVAEAANLLLNSPEYMDLVQTIRDVVADWDRTPRVFGGERAPLNVLIDIGVDNVVALDRVLALVDRKRAHLPHVRKLTYQRDLMRDRRQREYAALRVHEMSSPRVIGKDRTAFFADLRRRWAQAKNEFLEARSIELGRPLSYAERLSAQEEFWAQIDKNLAQAKASKLIS